MQDLEFQVGLYNGEAVGYCPQTGHISSISLRRVAGDMQARGELGEVGADLYEALDYADDRPEVGGRIGRKIKKGFKKVVAVAKKIAKSTLGKIVISALTMGTGSAAGAALSAVKVGIKLAKAAKSKKKTAASMRANKVAPIAAQLASKSITPEQARQKSRAQGLPLKEVQSAALALRVSAAAKKGNVNAQDLMRTAATIERAEANPQPLTVAPTQDAPGSSPFANPSGGGGGYYYAEFSDDAALEATEQGEPFAFPELDDEALAGDEIAGEPEDAGFAEGEG
jgi:hypothetical protein